MFSLVWSGRPLSLPALLIPSTLSLLCVAVLANGIFRMRLKDHSPLLNEQQTRLNVAFKEAEQQNKVLKEMQEMARVGYWFYDHPSGKLDWSPETFQIMERREAEGVLQSTEFVSRLRPEDRIRLLECTENILLNEKPYELEYQLTTPTGKIKYCREFGRPHYDAAGKLIGIYGAVQDVTEQRLAETALRENEERWRWIVQGTHDGIWDWDLEANSAYFSPQWKALLGYEDNELDNVPATWERLVHPDDLERAVLAKEAHLHKGTTAYSCEFRMRHKSGSHLWILDRGMAVRDEAGHPYRMVGVYTDISEMKQTQEKLVEAQNDLEHQVAERTKSVQEREHFLHLLIESIPLYLFWKDQRGAYTGCNSNYLKAHYSNAKEDFLGKTDAELYDTGEHVEESLRTDRLVLEEGKPVLHQIIPFSAPHTYIQWIDLNKTPVFDEEGRVIGLLGYFEDITKRLLVEKQIQEQRALLQKVIDTDPNLIYVTTQEGMFTLLNLATADFFGIPSEALLGMNESELLSVEHGNDPSIAALRIAMETLQETYIPECRVVTPLGKVRWLQIIKRPLHDASDEKPQVLGIATDITARKRVEEDLLRAKVSAEVANQAKSQLISSMSHELRTPLNAVLGFSELLADEEVGVLNTRQQRYADNILTSGKQLLRLINDVLDLAKLDARKLELDYSVFRPKEAIDNAIALVKQALVDKHIAFEVLYQDEIPLLSADQQRFKQILYTLLGNAIKLSSEKGKIEVLVSSTQTTQANIHMAIKNDGIGIRPEDLKRIFYETEPLEPTEKHKYTGIRIGLALTRRLTEAHGGRIWAESHGTETGSTFHVEIPLKGFSYPIEANDDVGGYHAV